MYAAGGTVLAIRLDQSRCHLSELVGTWEDDAAAPPPQLGAGHHGIACWGTGGPHHQGTGAADPGVVFMEAGGAGKHPGVEDPGGVGGNPWTDKEELGKG
jgi:hypothetical protein